VILTDEMSSKIEDQRFYHGLRAQADIADELKKAGDFLIRIEQFDTQTDTYLNVREENGLLGNYLLTVVNVDENQICSLPNQIGMAARPEFNSIMQLVYFYRIIALTAGGTCLKDAVSRPAWLIKHEVVQYSDEKDKIGSGNFCQVFKAKFMDQDLPPKTVAIKVCHRDNEGSAQEVYDAEASIIREAKLMSNYIHKNITGLIGVACDRLPVLLVMEFCPGGSLEDHLKNFSDISRMELTLYCFDVMRGMRYLHSHRYKCVHRDLASRNCLISSQGTIKIADFGLSTTVDKLGKNALKLKHLPIKLTAPECLSKCPLYSVASDIWSYGALIYEIFNKGVSIWPDDKDFKAMAKRISSLEMPELPESMPEFFQKLVKERIWQFCEKRIGSEGIYAILASYLCENQRSFPLVRDLVINRLPGVERKDLLIDSRDNTPVTATEPTQTKSSNSTEKSQKRSRHVPESSIRSSNRRLRESSKRANKSTETARSTRKIRARKASS